MISQAVDYKAGHFEHGLRDIDVVFDTVGGETLNRWWGVLNHNGRLVTIAADNEATSDERGKRAFFIVEPQHDELVEIGKLIDAGDLRTVVDRVLPFSQASDAYAGNLERSGRGKLEVAMGDRNIGIGTVAN
jgi:NADPH:quinone reductase-like Zn-dependent oxidoreductase